MITTFPLNDVDHDLVFCDLFCFIMDNLKDKEYLINHDNIRGETVQMVLNDLLQNITKYKFRECSKTISHFSNEHVFSTVLYLFSLNKKHSVYKG